MHAWAVGQANPLFGMFIVNTSLYFITYNHRYYHVCEIILYYPNLTIIADRQLPSYLIVPIGLDILTEFTIIFIVTVYFCISMSGE